MLRLEEECRYGMASREILHLLSVLFALRLQVLNYLPEHGAHRSGFGLEMFCRTRHRQKAVSRY